MQTQHLTAPVARETTLRLQALLVATLDLRLNVKQAHWNVHGLGFRSLHLHLDEIADGLPELADTLAERIVTLGASPDGRAATIVRESPFEALPAGRLETSEAIDDIASRIALVIDVAREHLGPLGDADPVSQDLVIELLRFLEKEHWMLRSSAYPTA